MKRIFSFLTVILLVSSFLGTGYFLYQKSEEPPVVYETDSVFVTDIVKKTVATGSIVPRQEIEVKSQVSGVVDKLYVEAGEHLKAGDLIAKIKIIPDVVALNNAQAAVREAEINFNNSRKELQRQKDLYEEKVISDYEYNQFLLEYNLRKQQLEAAESNLQLIEEGASKKSGAVSNLVRSTVNGMVLDAPVKEGSFIVETNTFNDGTTIATIANMNEMIFEGQVDESEVGKLVEGMELKLKIGALETEEFFAKLEYISPKGVEDEGAIQFEIRAAVNLKKDAFLRAGYSANADIVLDERNEVLAVKESNLIFEDDGVYVEVEKSSQEFEKKKITTGLSDGINIEVISGVSASDKIKRLI